MKGSIMSGEAQLINDTGAYAYEIIPSVFVLIFVLVIYYLYRAYSNISFVRMKDKDQYAIKKTWFKFFIPFYNIVVVTKLTKQIWLSYSSSKAEIKKGKVLIRKWKLLLFIITSYGLGCILLFYFPGHSQEIILTICCKAFLFIPCIHFCFKSIELFEKLNSMEQYKLLAFFMSRKMIKGMRKNF